MVDVVEIVVFQVRGRNYRFEKVRHELCNNCGERIFDLETNRMFDEKILLRRESRVA